MRKLNDHIKLLEKKARELKRSKLSYRAIGLELGVSREWVRRHLCVDKSIDTKCADGILEEGKVDTNTIGQEDGKHVS